MKIQVEYCVRSVMKSWPDDAMENLVGALRQGVVDDLPDDIEIDAKQVMAVNFFEDDGAFIDTVLL